MYRPSDTKRSVFFVSVTENTPPPGSTEGGLLNAIVGSIIMTVLGVGIGAPIGLFAGTYLAEYGKHDRLTSVIRFISPPLAGIVQIEAVRLGFLGGKVLCLDHVVLEDLDGFGHGADLIRTIHPGDREVQLTFRQAGHDVGQSDKGRYEKPVGRDDQGAEDEGPPGPINSHPLIVTKWRKGTRHGCPFGEELRPQPWRVTGLVRTQHGFHLVFQL